MGFPTSWLRLTASYGEGYRSPQALQLEEGEQAPFAKVRSYEAGATLREGDRFSLSARSVGACWPSSGAGPGDA